MPTIDTIEYQQTYGELLPKSVKVSDVRRNIQLYCYSNRIYMLVKDSDKVIGNATVSPKEIAGRQYLHIDGIYVISEYRKTSALYWLLYSFKEVANVPIIADGAIFADGIELIDALISHKVFNVSRLDVSTGKKTPLLGKINSSEYCYIFETARIGCSRQIFGKVNLGCR